MKLIDKEKVAEEIERRIKKYAAIDVGHSGELDALYGAKCKALMEILSFLDTLEVKEVDLVEELDYDDYMTFFKEHPEYNNGDWGFEETWTFGQYCYKLGLKARK